MGRPFHHHRHPGLPGVPGGQARADLHRLGHPHLQHQGLEGALLPDDRRPLPGLQEMLREANWEKYGVVNGVARDPRCENCMVHCGYDPSGALGTNYQPGDNWKNLKYNFGARPRPYPASPQLLQRAFNGVSIGKGHLAPARAALKTAGLTQEGADTEFYVQQMKASAATGASSGANRRSNSEGCASGDTSQRDELLTKIAAKKDV